MEAELAGPCWRDFPHRGADAVEAVVATGGHVDHDGLAVDDFMNDVGRVDLEGRLWQL